MLFLSAARLRHAARPVPFIICHSTGAKAELAGRFRAQTKALSSELLRELGGQADGRRRTWAQCLAGDTGQGTVLTAVRHRPGTAFAITTTWLWSGVCVWGGAADLLGV